MEGTRWDTGCSEVGTMVCGLGLGQRQRASTASQGEADGIWGQTGYAGEAGREEPGGHGKDRTGHVRTGAGCVYNLAITHLKKRRKSIICGRISSN